MSRSGISQYFILGLLLLELFLLVKISSVNPYRILKKIETFSMRSRFLETPVFSYNHICLQSL